MTLKVEQKTKNSAINLALDTLKIKKQALVFVNTKRSAEKTAEDIAYQIKEGSDKLEALSYEILQVLSRPTKQCERLARCIKKGIAFHHAGLASKQRELIENNFRDGTIKIIACTPTLAAGVDLPAFRALIKDLKRFGIRGSNYIPVLEYLQMAGRAGRPGKEDFGEAIIFANTDQDKEDLTEKYVYGEPEDIYSKLAVEPVLRTYVLSLISTGFVSTEKELIKFFSETFWAYQFEDMHKLESIIDKMINLLKDCKFIETSSQDEDFLSANDMFNRKLKPTRLGKRVAELYMDPLTANHLIQCMRTKKLKPISLLNMIAHTIELKPLLKVTSKDYDRINEELNKDESKLPVKEPAMYEDEFQDYLNAFKTSLMLKDWTDENDEETLLEKYNIRPGELKAKVDISDWLLYSSVELAKILNMREMYKELAKLRIRLKYGVKEELLTLLKLKNIGRVRARKLYQHKIKDLKDIRKSDVHVLASIIGKATAIDVKQQVGQKVKQDIKVEEKKKGQQSLVDF
jgi:helicase